MLQVGETEPFISELLGELTATIQDLETHQIHMFYEAVGLMISADSDAKRREQYLVCYSLFCRCHWACMKTRLLQVHEQHDVSGICVLLRGALCTDAGTADGATKPDMAGDSAGRDSATRHPEADGGHPQCAEHPVNERQRCLLPRPALPVPDHPHLSGHAEYVQVRAPALPVLPMSQVAFVNSI